MQRKIRTASPGTRAAARGRAPVRSNCCHWPARVAMRAWTTHPTSIISSLPSQPTMKDKMFWGGKPPMIPSF